jgi:hypothetical protein
LGFNFLYLEFIVEVSDLELVVFNLELVVVGLSFVASLTVVILDLVSADYFRSSVIVTKHLMLDIEL